MSERPPDIRLLGIRKAFGDHVVFDGLNLVFPGGTTTALTGSSGCGKTTLLRLIAHLETPDTGTITGVHQGDIAYAFQEPRLFPQLTAFDNAVCVMQDPKQKDFVHTLFREAGLETAKMLYPSQLSGGMRQRLSVLRALASGRKLILLDEPVKELDAETAGLLRGIIRRHTAGHTVIWVTHDEKDIACAETTITL